MEASQDAAPLIELVGDAPGDAFLRASQAIETARLLLCDLDGCLILGGAPAPGAPAFVARHSAKIRLVSNNSTLTPDLCSRRLGQIGVHVAPDHIHLAGAAGLQQIAQDHPQARIMLIGSRALRVQARRLGLQVVQEEPDVIFLAKDLSLRFEDLPPIAAAGFAGARLIVANTDPSRPIAADRLEPETGVQLQALRTFAPGLAFDVVGKPWPMLFEQALAAAGVGAGEAVMIGDTLATDVAGAGSLGITTILVDSSRTPWRRLCP